jgi:hypothetical protein
MKTDQEYQLFNLERIIDGGVGSPVFKPNAKFPVEGLARIAYSDVMDRKYVIRDTGTHDLNSCWNEKTKVIAEYRSMEALVDDGWRLD